ncbi:MAG: hypothetical protein ACKVVT_18735 [Dehalococcoidia bacterium]
MREWYESLPNWGQNLFWVVVLVGGFIFVAWALQGSRLLEWLDSSSCYYDEDEQEEVCEEPYEQDR